MAAPISRTSKLGQTPLSFHKALKTRHAKTKPPPFSTEDADLQPMEAETPPSMLLGPIPIEMKSSVNTPSSSKTSNTTQSLPRTSPDIFEHHKLTPHELKTLVGLEESIPLNYLNGDTSEDATSWSQIFVAAKRMIVGKAVLSREREDADRGKGVVERSGGLEDKLARCEELEEDLREGQRKDGATSICGLMTPLESGSGHVTEGSAESAASWTTAASGIATSGEPSIAVPNMSHPNGTSISSTGIGTGDSALSTGGVWRSCTGDSRRQEKLLAGLARCD